MPSADQIIDGRYRLKGAIGEGGMGTVYRAVHDKLDRDVAIKVLSAELGQSKELRLRFEREAKNLAAMSHPHIVAVTDYGHIDEAPYLVMELLEGEPLDALIERDAPLPAAVVRTIFEQILRALAFTHSRGLAHRDLKPANVFLQRLADEPMHVKLLDFGLAKFVAGERKGRGPALTRTGTILGTPAYMSPEQAAGQGAGERSDVYSAGILLFEMLTGARPFQGDAPDLIRQHLIAPLPSLEEACPGLRPTPHFERFIAKATEKEARSRFADAGEMLTAFTTLPKPMVEGGPQPKAVVMPRPSLAPTALPSGGRGTPRAGGSQGTPETGPRPGPTPGSAPMPPTSEGSPATQRSSLQTPRATSLLLAAAGAALIFLAAGAAALTALLSGGDEAGAPESAVTGGPGTSSPARVPAAVPPPAGELDEPAPPRATVQPTGHAGTDPWVPPIPRALGAARREVSRGAMSRATEQRLESYNRQNRSDPRGFLLLGHGYFARGWRPDALDRYERAFDIDVNARHDPQMRDNLIRLGGHGNVGRRARTMVVTFYGAEARTAVQALLDGSTLRRSERAGIELLRAELAAL